MAAEPTESKLYNDEWNQVWDVIDGFIYRSNRDIESVDEDTFNRIVKVYYQQNLDFEELKASTPGEALFYGYLCHVHEKYLLAQKFFRIASDAGLTGGMISLVTVNRILNEEFDNVSLIKKAIELVDNRGYISLAQITQGTESGGPGISTPADIFSKGILEGNAHCYLGLGTHHWMLKNGEDDQLISQTQGIEYLEEGIENGSGHCAYALSGIIENYPDITGPFRDVKFTLWRGAILRDAMCMYRLVFYCLDMIQSESMKEAAEGLKELEELIGIMVTKQSPFTTLVLTNLFKLLNSAPVRYDEHISKLELALTSIQFPPVPDTPFFKGLSYPFDVMLNGSDGE